MGKDVSTPGLENSASELIGGFTRKLKKKKTKLCALGPPPFLGPIHNFLFTMSCSFSYKGPLNLHTRHAPRNLDPLLSRTRGLWLPAQHTPQRCLESVGPGLGYTKEEAVSLIPQSRMGGRCPHWLREGQWPHWVGLSRAATAPSHEP